MYARTTLCSTPACTRRMTWASGLFGSMSDGNALGIVGLSGTTEVVSVPGGAGAGCSCALAFCSGGPPIKTTAKRVKIGTSLKEIVFFILIPRFLCAYKMRRYPFRQVTTKSIQPKLHFAGKWYSRPELNGNPRFRKPLLYPFELREHALNYSTLRSHAAYFSTSLS